MDTSDEGGERRSASEKLADVLARRKTALGSVSSKGAPRPGRAERSAGALSASKSKPAPRR